MKNHRRNQHLSFPLVAILLAITSMAWSDENSTENAFVEGWREGVIETRYLMIDALSSSSIEVEVKGSKAILSGFVATDIEKSLAEEVALSVSGIEEVEDRLDISDAQQTETLSSNPKSEDSPQAPEQAVVAADNSTTNDSTTDHLGDAMITATIKTRMLTSRYLNPLEIEVSTAEGVVELKGQVSSDAEKELAYFIAQNTKGVKDVHNYMTVEPNIS